MNPPKVASIVTVAVLLLLLLNAMLKYYTYFLLIVAAHKEEPTLDSEVPHPHDLYVPFLTFIPTRLPVALRPWVLLTASFIEESFIGLALAAASIFYLGWYLEARWGARAFAKFVIIAVLACNMALYFWYATKNAFGQLSSVPPVVSSTTPIVMACLVAVKQRIANHYIILYKNLLRIKVTFVPFSWYVLLVLAGLIWPDWHILHCEALAAFTISWTYLRFFKDGANERQSYLIPFSIKPPHVEAPMASPTNLKFDENLPKGDRSDLFALSTFFPSYLGLVVKKLSDAVFNFAVRQGLLNAKDFVGHDEDDEPHVGGINSKLFSLSRLKGAENVGMVPAGDRFKSFFGMNPQDESSDSIKLSMDKRRKLAIRQLE